MEKLFNSLKTDEEFALKFKNYLKKYADNQVNGMMKEFGSNLDHIVMTCIGEFAKNQEIELEESEKLCKQMSELSRQISLQLNEMVKKQFSAIEFIDHSFQYR